MAKEQRQRYFKIISSGWHSSKTINHMCKNAKSAKNRGNISKRNEMTLKDIIEIKPFDYPGIDFMGPFPTSNSNVYILVCVDFITKWVEAITCVANDA